MKEGWEIKEIYHLGTRHSISSHLLSKIKTGEESLESFLHAHTENYYGKVRLMRMDFETGRFDKEKCQDREKLY